MKLSFGTSKQICGEASVVINVSDKDVFCFIANDFFLNYPKWTPEVVKLQALDGDQVKVGVKGRQVREDDDSQTESIFEIIEYEPYSAFVIQGLSTPYKQTYMTVGEGKNTQTRLTFRFDLLEIEIFMRPFEKLIRVAIEDGAENTVERIRELVCTQQMQIAS